MWDSITYPCHLPPKFLYEGKTSMDINPLRANFYEINIKKILH